MIPELMATRERVAWIFHEKARNHHCLRRRRAIAATPKPPRASASNKAIGASSPVLESTFSSPGASGPSGASGAVRRRSARGGLPSRFRASFCGICNFERGFCHKRSQGQRLLGRACMPSRAALRGRRRAPNHHAQSRRHAGSRQPRSVKTALEPNRAGRRRPRTRPEA